MDWAQKAIYIWPVELAGFNSGLTVEGFTCAVARQWAALPLLWPGEGAVAGVAMC